ncbi:MAG: S41 family peptidase [Deltaproteobacteria bacterium]|nr:MAG: S41 family peptidase [Deltaproteobacteria bacterium]
MRRKRSFRPAALVVIVLAGAFAVYLSPIGRTVARAARDTYASLETFANIMAIVQKNYVEEVSTEQLIEGAIDGMLSSLDPHSAYLTPELFRELQVDTRGSFGGLGIEITIRDEVLTIIAPIEDTPAYRAGIKPGDEIIKIDGQLTKGMSLMKAVSLMRGAKGTDVVLTLHREGVPDLFDVKLTREIIRVKSVKDTKLYDDRYGYVRVVQFQEGTSRELAGAIEDLEKQAPSKLQGLIIDLRHNPGGLLNEAVKVADLFLDAGLIVYTEGRVDSQKQRFLARNDGDEPDVPIVVLVDEGSASASEIVAGALQDHKRAILVGTKTFGKGSVQTILPIGHDSALRLTTARYYTPSGRSIQATGIEPDVRVEPVVQVAKATERFQVHEKDLSGHMENEQAVSDAPAEPVAVGDPQIERALDLLKTWRVFSRFHEQGLDLRAGGEKDTN